MAENYTPQLTLFPDISANTELAETPSGEDIQMQDMPELTSEEQSMVEQFSKQIDLSDTNMVLQYGAAAQKNIAEFSESALETVRTKDFGEVGGMLSDLVAELKGFNFDPDEKKGILGLFKRASSRLSDLKIKYNKVEANVDNIVNMLENHQVTLMKDIAVLDKMYDKNLAYFKELSMYILAGKKRLSDALNVELVSLQKKAEQTGLPEDAQAANDFANMCNRFDKKLHDLELTRTVSIQMAPQIRLLQNNDALLAEKIQSSIVNTIPLWKSQMVLSLGISHSQQAMEAQRAVTDMTNELLLKNAEMLKSGTVDIAQESERGIVDIETLQQTNQSLIATLEEVRQIQETGREKRRSAEAELLKIENDLKEKLLSLRSSN